VFALDLAGHGKSDGIGHHRVEDYTEDVLILMRELRLNAAVWVGHSMGGAIALDAAIRFPKRVLGIALVGTGARMRVDPNILRSAEQEATFGAAIGLIGERSFAASTERRLKELALERMTEMRSSVLLGDLMACDAFDRMDQVEQIRAPTLVLCGAEDRMTPPQLSEYLSKHIGGSTLRIIVDAGHMVMLERPDEVAESLDKFLRAVPYTPGM